MAFKFSGDELVDLYEGWENYSSSFDKPDIEFDTIACPPHQESIAFKSIVPIICGLVCLLSLLGNSVVILVISSMRKARSATDVYLLNLAIADILFAITLPVWVVSQVHEWIFGTVMCKIITLLKEVNFYSGVLLLVCISIDRYLAIVYATQATALKRHWVRYACAGVWVVSFLLALPLICFREAFLAHDNSSHAQWVCYEKIGWNKTNDWRVRLRILPHTFGFIIPVVIMLFCYGVTVHKLLRTKNTQRQKAMKVIISVVIVFLISWLPYNISMLADTLLRAEVIADSCERRRKIDAALASTEIVGFVHCCINPIIYAFIGQKFWNQFLKTLAEQGIINKEVLIRFRKGSTFSSSSGNTSTTL